MELKKYDPNGLFTSIVRAVDAAREAKEIIYGVELTREEYDALHKELDIPPERYGLTVVPMIGLPIILEGRDLELERINKLNEEMKAQIGFLAGLANDDSDIVLN